MVNVKVIPGKFPMGGFWAHVYLDGESVFTVWRRVKGDAVRAAKTAAEEMGLVTDGVKL